MFVLINYFHFHLPAGLLYFTFNIKFWRNTPPSQYVVKNANCYKKLVVLLNSSRDFFRYALYSILEIENIPAKNSTYPLT